jgi:HEAT repeat protein
MNKTHNTYFFLICVSIGLNAFSFGDQLPGSRKLCSGDKEEASPSPSNGKPDTISTPSPNDFKAAVEKVAKALEKFGLTKVPTADEYLRTAVASDDRVQITRAFVEIIWSGRWKMNEAIPALKQYLDSSHSFVRYRACEDLLTVGDESGAKGLIQFVLAPAPINDGGDDLRVKAATMLARCRWFRRSICMSWNTLFK